MCWAEGDNQGYILPNKIQIARVVTLIEEGHSRRRVAQMMNVSHSAISRLLEHGLDI
jgi:predicted transcriptional regulator